jgi:hypothetical protein
MPVFASLGKTISMSFPDRAIAVASFAAAVTVAAVLIGMPAPSVPELPGKPPVPQAQADASSRTPVGMVVNWARTIRASHAEPQAIVWDQVLASRDGTVVCLSYRLGNDSRRIAFVSAGTGFRQMDWDAACSHGVSAVDDARKWISLP